MNSGIGCLQPPTPTTSDLHAVWDGGLIPFNDNVHYNCDRGMKFKQDLALAQQNATCRDENKFDIPDWMDCVESAYSFEVLKLVIQSFSP